MTKHYYICIFEFKKLLSSLQGKWILKLIFPSGKWKFRSKITLCYYKYLEDALQFNVFALYVYVIV